MDTRLIQNWRNLIGAKVEIRHQGILVTTGTVEEVTDDGNILGIHSPTQGRRLFPKVELYEAWATEERIGFHYRISRTGSIGSKA